MPPGPEPTRGVSLLPAACTGLIIAMTLGGGWSQAYRVLHLHGWLGRPAMSLEEERALLIVGFMSSGTKQMTQELQSLGFEVQHEQSDARRYLCRDGTVSWAHAIRFLRYESETARLAAVSNLCASAGIVGFSFAFFDAVNECQTPRQQDVASKRWDWDACWSSHCKRVLTQELSCAVEEHQPPRGGSARCFTPFARTLLQVRHPLRNLESLVAGYCASEDTVERAAAAEQLRFLRKLGLVRPASLASPAAGGDTCSVRFGWALVKYLRAAMPRVDGIFRVETTPPCEVGVLGLGLRNQSASAQEAGNAAASTRARRLLPEGLALAAEQECAVRSAAGVGPGRGESHGYLNRKNAGKRKIQLELQAIRKLDGALGDELAALIQELGYE